MRKERQTIKVPGPLTIRLLGAFAMHRNGMETPRARTRKEQSLLALLILRHASALDRDWLASVFWPDSGEKQALYNLRRSLSNLREILSEDALCLSSPTPRSVRLDLSNAQIDVLAFDSALEQNTELSLEQAVALYRGPLLEGFGEAWISPEREVREQAYLQALETLAAHARKRQDETTAIRHLRAVIQTDPLRETAQRALLQTLFAQNDLASATDAYHRFRLLLHRELHTEPAPETTALYQQIKARFRSADSVASSAVASSTAASSADLPTTPKRRPPRHFPRPLSSRVGRDSEIAEIQTALHSARLVTLTGTGGIGKTRIALETAEQIASHYPDGVWFAGLSEIYEGDRVPSFLASTFGLTCDKSKRQEPLDVVCRFLENKSLLLILDNCEHLIEACARIAETLLHKFPDLTLLATSRQSLGLAGEHIWRVPPLSLPSKKVLSASSGESSPLAASESERLFQERARQVSPDFQLTPTNHGAVVRICRLVEGIPFAIELAAAWMSALTVEQLAARLSEPLLLLTGNRRTFHPHQQTLRATLNWSYCLLTEEEKRLLCRLSVFAGGCTLEAVEAICGEDANVAGGILGLLAQLVDKSLVVFSDEEAGARYRMLEMTRAYADEQISPAERKCLRQSHANYFLTLAESLLENEDRWNLSEAWYRQIACEYENLYAALLWLETEPADASAVLRLGAALWRYWAKSSHLSEGRIILSRLISNSSPSVSIERGRLLYGAGVLATDHSDYAIATVYFQEARQICHDLGAGHEEADCLLQLGIIARDRGDHREAQKLLQQSFAVRCNLPGPGDITPILISLGNVACDVGDYTLAHAYYTESLQRSEQAGKKLSIAYASRALGGLAYQQGHYQEAERWYARCRTVFQELGHKWGVAYVCNRMGAIAALRNDFPEAHRLIQQGLQIWQEAQDGWGVALALISLGLTASQAGDFKRAQTLYGETLVRAYELENRCEACELLERLGSLAACQEEWERAVVLLAAAEAERQRLSLPQPHLEKRLCAQATTRIRAVVDENIFSLWHEKGINFTLHQAVAYAHPFAERQILPDPFCILSSI